MIDLKSEVWNNGPPRKHERLCDSGRSRLLHCGGKGDEIHEVSLRCRFQVNDARVLREAALQGHGVVLQANLIFAEDLASGRLVQVLADYQTPERPLHILFAAGRPPTQILRSFIDYVVAAFARTPST